MSYYNKRSDCLNCESKIDNAVFSYSTEKYGQPLCKSCQNWFRGIIKHTTATDTSITLYFALKKLGVPANLIQMAPSHVIGRDRTYSSAVALRDWFREHNISVHSMNVLTEDAHARRTQLLYRKAFGKNVLVGIIAVPNPDYNPRNWWHYSDGVREVIGESIAYIYARFFFYPSTSPHTEKSAQVSRADTKQ